MLVRGDKMCLAFSTLREGWVELDLPLTTTAPHEAFTTRTRIHDIKGLSTELAGYTTPRSPRNERPLNKPRAKQYRRDRLYRPMHVDIFAARTATTRWRTRDMRQTPQV